MRQTHEEQAGCKQTPLFLSLSLSLANNKNLVFGEPFGKKNNQMLPIFPQFFR